MSYQSEERYWTDYLRIALPIAGLLLLLGVFWYWASSFIGDDNDNPPRTPEAAIVNTPITADTPTPTTTTAVTIAVQTIEPTQPAEAPAQPTQETDAQPTPTAGDAADPGAETNGGGEFSEGDAVAVLDDDVRLRADASTEADIVETMSAGTELTVLSSEPVEAEGYVWWNVEVDLTGNTGWVAGDWIDFPS